MPVLLFLCCLPVFATPSPLRVQMSPDTLIPTDTIGIAQRRTLFATDQYTFHAATHLAGLQLVPILRQSSDSTVLRLAMRAKRRYTLPLPLILGSYGLVLGSVRAIRVWDNPGLAGGLLVGSVGTLIESYVLGFSAPNAMRRAVQRHNQRLRSTDDYYTSPRSLAGMAGEAPLLSEADTVLIQPYRLGSRYTYRGVLLSPDLQLTEAMQSLKDPFITEGLRQNRAIGTVAGLIGGFSAGYLSGYCLTRLLTLAAGYQTRPANPLVYAALGGLAVTITIASFNNRVTRQVVRRYNERLRTR